ncbi:hypothetical protein PF003_g21965 [Phytophthora fragariae]|nr:hypothetical protein PF003_g21965 [Phytophthora fragariae]
MYFRIFANTTMSYTYILVSMVGSVLHENYQGYHAADVRDAGQVDGVDGQGYDSEHFAGASFIAVKASNALLMSKYNGNAAISFLLRILPGANDLTDGGGWLRGELLLTGWCVP